VTKGSPSRAGASAFARHLEELRESHAFKAYERVRDWVLEVNERAGDPSAASDYWREELEHFQYMLDASPLIVDKLRHHCLYLTGIRPYDYRSNKDERRRQFAEKRAALIELQGNHLLVPESRELGGFGFDIDGELYNIDTLKFFEALIAMERAGVLRQLSALGRRAVVCEIGGGWGGFGYQFKTLFDDTTYVLVDFPEVFLFSAVYLLSMFPDADVVFWGADDTCNDPEVLSRADFVFVPHTDYRNVALPSLDLVVNMVSFQEMTSEQVADYAGWAWEQSCPHLYSLNRDRSPYNRQLTNVRAILDEHYALREISVLPVSYVSMLGKAPKAKAQGRRLARMLAPPRPGEKPSEKKRSSEHLDYRHVVGLRRDTPETR
jgi:putative sugar O-methyltransferase